LNRGSFDDRAREDWGFVELSSSDLDIKGAVSSVCGSACSLSDAITTVVSGFYGRAIINEQPGDCRGVPSLFHLQERL
jgi:hypothetical protein